MLGYMYFSVHVGRKGGNKNLNTQNDNRAAMRETRQVTAGCFWYN